MIKSKTKEQKKQDENRWLQSLKNLELTSNELSDDYRNAEGNFQYITIGAFGSFLSAVDSLAATTRTKNEGYTFTNYETDSEHEQWKNSTHIDRYNID